MSEEFNFSTTIEHFPVTIDGKKYVITEATEDVVVEFRGIGISSQRLVDGERTGIDGKALSRAEPFLVSKCLKDAETMKEVGMDFVLNLPSRIVGPIFDKAKELSRLNKIDDTTGRLLRKWLARGKGPIKWDELVTWANGLDDNKETRIVKRLFNSVEDDVKN